VISTHLPILQVVLPLMAAPLCLLLRHAAWANWLAVITSWLTFIIAIFLLLQTLETGPLSYSLGGWAPPWGIEYRIDVLNAFVLLFVSGICAIVATASGPSVTREIGRDHGYLFYCCFLLFETGLLGVAATGDAFNLFVFLEISSLASYILVSFGRDRRALAAAYRYLILGTIGATFYLIGIGLLYQATGTLNFADLATRVALLDDSRTIRAAFAFLTVGISLKLALFPLHLWLPNAYAFAPSAVTALLAGTATKVALYILLRIFFTLFGGDFSFGTLPVDVIVMPLAVAAVFVGSVAAIFENDVKRMLAYSTIAQIGYMVIGISMASVLGLTGGIVHMFNHAIIKTALFLSLACAVWRVGPVTIDALAGLGKRMPLTMGAFVLAGMSLIGMPGTAGFVSKWYLVIAALERGWWWIALVVIVGSLLSTVYIWRILEVAYFRPVAEGAPAGEAPLLMIVPTWVLVLATIYFGIDTRFSVGMARLASESLLGLVP
jgi:multicomponent Na+:H+ antiporter subunit D